jgi:mannose-1-phosphate guanylyltransferase
MRSFNGSGNRRSGGSHSAVSHARAVIMAGGSGTRFWPLSRRKRPKQLLELFGRGTLLEQTVARIRGLVPHERTYVFTSELVRAEVIRRLPGLPRQQIVAEPAARNTAPCIGLAAHEILRRDPEGILVVLPSDHVIRKPAAFRQALRAACSLASTDGLTVLLGLKPSDPHTGYGYVRLGAPAGSPGGFNGAEIFRVEQFTEKPSLEKAKEYVSSGRYLWNGGMFIWRASTIIRHLEAYQPELARGLAQLAKAGGARSAAAMRRFYPRLEKISVDYALMEKIPDVLAVAADIGWSDVGSWSVAYELNRKDRDGNVRPKRSLCLDSGGNMIISPQKFVVTVGVRDLVIVETQDALLVSRLERSQDVGKAVQEMEKQGLEELL